jgi:hypothetical protein
VVSVSAGMTLFTLVRGRGVFRTSPMMDFSEVRLLDILRTAQAHQQHIRRAEAYRPRPLLASDFYGRLP